MKKSQRKHQIKDFKGGMYKKNAVLMDAASNCNNVCESNWPGTGVNRIICDTTSSIVIAYYL